MSRKKKDDDDDDDDDVEEGPAPTHQPGAVPGKRVLDKRCRSRRHKKCFWKSEYERGESLYRTSTIHCTTTKLVADNEATGLSSAPLLVRKCSAHQLATSISELCSLQCWSWDANFCSIGVFWVTTSRTRGLKRSLLDLSLTSYHSHRTAVARPEPHRNRLPPPRLVGATRSPQSPPPPARRRHRPPVLFVPPPLPRRAKHFPLEPRRGRSRG